MPWRIDKVSDGYKLYNLDKKKYVNKKFNTKLSNIIEIEKIKSILINHPDLLSFFQIMCEIVNEEINDE